MTKRHLVIATRESPLALFQSEWVKKELLNIHPHLSIDLLGMTTYADKMLNVSLTKLGGKGLFVKELEEALLDKRADIAVHSMKDVPMVLLPGFALPVVCKREDARDAFVSNRYAALAELPHGAMLGTSSVRREAQLRALRPDLTIKPLRGNVQTRLAKLDALEFDAIILAAAGLKRLQLQDRIKAYLSYDDCLPAPGQGALGIEIRSEDAAILQLIEALNNEAAQVCVQAERALCRELEGNCMVPIGAHAVLQHDEIHLQGLVASVDGRQIIRVRLTGNKNQAEEIGIRAAKELLQNGAQKILAAYK